MSMLHSATKYDVHHSRHRICTNPECDNCPPGYGNWEGKKADPRIVCPICGERMTTVEMEPRS